MNMSMTMSGIIMGTMPAGEAATSHESGKLALSLDVVVVTAEACFKTYGATLLPCLLTA